MDHPRRSTCILTAVALFSLCILSSTSAQAQVPAGSIHNGYSEEGRRALAAGDYRAAQASFEQEIEFNPAVAESHATLAAIDFKLRDYDKAVQETRTALRLKPALPRLHSLLGLSLAEMGKYSEALPELEKGFKQTGDTDTRRLCGLQLLRAYTSMRDDGAAVETALALNRLYPNDPEVLYHTGRVVGNYAYVLMERLHDEAPNSVWMLQAQGEANESQKNYETAVASYRHVLAIDPDRPAIHYRIARVYLSRYEDTRSPADRELARQEFQAELNRDSSNGNAAYELAQMAADDNQLQLAQQQFERLIDRYPAFEQALVGLAEVYLEQRTADRAVVPLRRATTLDPNDQVAWYRLALAEKTIGDKEAAERAMAKFRSLHQPSSSLEVSSAVSEITPQKIKAAD